MLFLKFRDQNVFVVETYGTPLMFDAFLIPVPLFLTLFFPKKSQLIGFQLGLNS